MRKPFLPGLARSPYGDTLPAVTFHAHGSADEVATDWANRLGQSSAKIQAGVQRVQQAPGQAAAAAAQKWINALNDGHTLQKYTRNVGAVTLSQWQDSMVNKGIPRIAQGAQAAIPKFTGVMTALLRFEDQLQAQVKQMPSDTYAAREARMLTWTRGMQNFQKPAGT